LIHIQSCKKAKEPIVLTIWDVVGIYAADSGGKLMKIVITGAAGLIGSTLGVELIKQGHSVLGIDNLSGGLTENAGLFGEHFFEADCNDFPTLVKLMSGAEVLVDCAAAPYEGLSIFSPAFIFKNVCQSSITSFSAALASGVKRVVYFSSMARYGDSQAPFRETAEATPIDPYGMAKLTAEKTLSCLKMYHEFSYTVIVPHNVYGPRQRYYDPYRNVISLNINRILSGLRPVVFGDGSQRRSFT
jgi:UDP-glucose 4-epimerase